MRFSFIKSKFNWIGLSLVFALALLISGCGGSSGASGEVNSEQQVAQEAHQASFDSNESGRSLLFENDPRISYCEVSAAGAYSGYRDRKAYPLASLSKVMTSAWVLEKMGADYRFKSEWYLRPVDPKQGVYDAYLRANYDPVINPEKILFYLAQLKARGVKSIRELMIDETTRVYLSVLNQPHVELEQVPVGIKDSGANLFQMMNSENWGPQTELASKNLKNWMQSKNINLSVPQSFDVQSVVYQSADKIDRSRYSLAFSIPSAPILTYLKSINVFSNNYLSDFLFWRLGGAAQFINFQTTKLLIPQKEMSIYTGSGLADQKNGIRRDNLATCQSVLKVLRFVYKKSQQVNLNLGYLLLNPSRDTEGTLQTKVPATLRQDNLVVKTGRLYDNPALNLAGIVSTQQGPAYFAFLGHDFKNSDADDIERSRDSMLTNLLKFYPTQKSFVSSNLTTIFL